MCVNIIYVCICLYCVICLILYYRSLLICTNKEFMKFMKKYIRKKQLGLLTETHEVLLWLIKTPNIHAFKMAAPTEDRFPLTIL